MSHWAMAGRDVVSCHHAVQHRQDFRGRLPVRFVVRTPDVCPPLQDKRCRRRLFGGEQHVHELSKKESVPPELKSSPTSIPAAQTGLDQLLNDTSRHKDMPVLTSSAALSSVLHFFLFLSPPYQAFRRAMKTLPSSPARRRCCRRPQRQTLVTAGHRVVACFGVLVGMARSTSGGGRQVSESGDPSGLDPHRPAKPSRRPVTSAGLPLVPHLPAPMTHLCRTSALRHFLLLLPLFPASSAKNARRHPGRRRASSPATPPSPRASSRPTRPVFLPPPTTSRPSVARLSDVA